MDARDNNPNVNVRGHDDSLMEFIYQEAVRGLLHQQNVVEALNTRAGNLIFASAFATSLLGSRALSDGIERWDWIAMTLLFGIGILTAFMLALLHWRRDMQRSSNTPTAPEYLDGVPGVGVGSSVRTLLSWNRSGACVSSSSAVRLPAVR